MNQANFLASARTRKLIELIKKIARHAAQHQLRYFIGGGFAIDLYTGKLTREHDDVDLVVDVVDSEAWKRCFEQWGYAIGRDDYMVYFPHSFTVGERTANESHHQPDHILVEVWPVELMDDGTLYPPHIPEHPGRAWWKEKRHDNLQFVRFEGVDIWIEEPNITIDQKLAHVRHHKQQLSEKHIHDLKLMGRFDEYREIIRELGDAVR